MTDSGGMRLGPDLSAVVRVTSSICWLLVAAALVALVVIYFPDLTDWRPCWEFSGWHGVAALLFVLVLRLTTLFRGLDDYAVWKDQAREWVAKGRHTTTEGTVESRNIPYQDGKSWSPVMASIRMGDREFCEQAWQDALRTGFGVGDYVRITHHEGAVLKVEVAEQSPRSVRES
ncbi:MAG: hypothetical protein GWO24_01055 [Akkermansiaceae bacterium]|nr:hypothetical protein [Akkermansiaceae bacterium]